MKTFAVISSIALSLLMPCGIDGAEPSQPGPPAPVASVPRYTLDNVMIDHFQARGATLSEALEALSVLSENATAHRYRPTFVVIGSGAAARPVNLNITRFPLSAAIARLAVDTGLLVTHRQDTVIFSARK
jgi:hypothetical protein